MEQKTPVVQLHECFTCCSSMHPKFVNFWYLQCSKCHYQFSPTDPKLTREDVAHEWNTFAERLEFIKKNGPQIHPMHALNNLENRAAFKELKNIADENKALLLLQYNDAQRPKVRDCATRLRESTKW